MVIKRIEGYLLGGLSNDDTSLGESEHSIIVSETPEGQMFDIIMDVRGCVMPDENGKKAYLHCCADSLIEFARTIIKEFGD
jgi:hypothetical protein